MEQPKQRAWMVAKRHFRRLLPETKFQEPHREGPNKRWWSYRSQPGWGQIRSANESRGFYVTCRRTLCVIAHDLENIKNRLKAWAVKSVQDGQILAESRVVALAKAQPLGEFESEPPGTPFCEIAHRARRSEDSVLWYASDDYSPSRHTPYS
jgi:hypothetical protein